jgi:hypothetical protein
VAVPARADHIPGATYTGSAATGGTVELVVSADGAAVTRFEAADVPTNCGAVSVTVTGSLPIVNHAFARPPADGAAFSGTFGATQQVGGTLSEAGECAYSVPWSATTSAALPPAPAADVTPADRRRPRRPPPAPRRCRARARSAGLRDLPGHGHRLAGRARPGVPPTRGVDPAHAGRQRQARADARPARARGGAPGARGRPPGPGPHKGHGRRRGRQPDGYATGEPASLAGQAAARSARRRRILGGPPAANSGGAIRR